MGALVLEIAARADAQPQAVRGSTVEDGAAAGAVVVFVADRVREADVRSTIDSLGAHESLTLEPLASPLADDLVRRARRVVIVVGERSRTSVGRVLKLAERYAKPCRVVRPA
jgi:hypothetical protein